MDTKKLADIIICNKCGILYDKTKADKKGEWRGKYDKDDENVTEMVIYVVCPLCKEWEEIGMVE